MSVESVLRAHAPEAPASLRTRVLELEPRRTTPSRRLALVLAVALVAAIAAAVVDGLVTSSPKQQTARLYRNAPSLRKAPAPSVGAGAVHGSFPAVASARLQQYEATLELRVKSVSSATSAATRVATSLGGYAQSVHYSSGGIASLVLRVPVPSVKTAIARLGALGTIVSQDLSVTDLQHLLQVESQQIAQMRRTIAALQAALRNPSLSDSQRVILRIRLANAKRALALRVGARSNTIGAGTSATVSLTLEKQGVVAPVPHHRGRLGRMVHSAVGFLGLEGTAVLYALIVLSPAAFAAALLWSLREARRRRDERLVME